VSRLQVPNPDLLFLVVLCAFSYANAIDAIELLAPKYQRAGEGSAIEGDMLTLGERRLCSVCGHGSLLSFWQQSAKSGCSLSPFKNR
jgi:hypothetical protein